MQSFPKYVYIYSMRKGCICFDALVESTGSNGRDFLPFQYCTSSWGWVQQTLYAVSYSTLLLGMLDSWLLPDWAYLQDWCRRLTKNFQDVYVFTVPLYLPKQDPDGKWRVVRIERPLYSFYHWLINDIDSWSYWFASQHICSNSLCQSSFGHKTLLSVFTWQTGTIFRSLCTTQCSYLWRSALN